jgi:diacylglycerol kinase family enzyme
MRIAVVMNAASGTGGEDADQREQHIRDAFQAAGVEPEIHHMDPERLTESIREIARDAGLVVAAGGDGTVSAVAGVLAGGTVPMAVLPLGTLNHFAKDLGMPLDLTEAAAAIVAGVQQPIDVGEVNGRVFVNNSSIGLYPETVIHRDRERERKGRSKWTAMVIAALRVLRRFPLLSARITAPGQALSVCTTPLIFIGNNEYKVNVLELGERARLDRGKLSLYMMRCKGRLYMFWLMVRAILGRLDAVRDFEAVATTEVTVRLRERHLMVALDGEVTKLRSPLHYRIRPGALTVIAPPRNQPA